MNHVLNYGGKKISYRLVYEDRSSLQVAVYPDATVAVKVPLHAQLDTIEAKLKRKARWILKQQSFFQQFFPKSPPKHFVNGETHLYMGRQYRLTIEKGDTTSVKLLGGSFLVSCIEDPNPICVKNAMEDWYRGRAKLAFSARLQACWERFGYPEVKYPKLSLRRMKTRWGSLSESGNLTLNTNLIQAPKSCIDYVITHELCHIRHPQHDADFFRLLEKKMPNWSKLKSQLEQIMS